MVELNGDGFYDLLVRLDSVVVGRANIMIKSINEEIIKEIDGEGAEEESFEKEVGGDEDDEDYEYHYER